jgi:hypothetical protein
MSLQRRVARLEQAITPDSDAVNDRLWRETLNNISKVYGNGQPVSDTRPAPTREEVDAIIAQAYAETAL